MIDVGSLRIHRRIYRTFLLLYPRSFRREYGALMTQAFCDRTRDMGTARAWLFVARDLLRSVPQQIMEASLMSQKWMAVLTTLSAVALVAFLGLGLGPPIFLAAGLVVVVGLMAVTSARREDRPTEYVYRDGAPKRWTWWTVLATMLASLYVLAAIGQLIDDPKATNVGALGIMLGFAGLIVGGLVLRERSKIGGHWMIIFATVPALMFFWIVWPTVVALAIIVGAVSEISRATPQAPQAV
jgi:hypothetical protein